MNQKITLGTLDLDVPEMPIGLRKKVVPAVMKYYGTLKKKVQGEQMGLNEEDYDLMIDIVVLTGLTTRPAIEALFATDKEFFEAIRVIAEQAGLKAEKKEGALGETSGETKALLSPTTTV